MRVMPLMMPSSTLYIILKNQFNTTWEGNTKRKETGRNMNQAMNIKANWK
jgi:hypothetical protein